MRRLLAAPRRFYLSIGGQYALTMLLLAGLLVGGLAPACAQLSETDRRDAIIDRSWLADTDGTLLPDTALKRSWTRYEGPLARGFTNSVTWIRLKIDPSAAGPGSLSSDRRLVLRIVPSRLDEVAAYRMDRPAEPPAVVGDKFRVSGLQQGLLNHGVVFDDAESPFEVLLRVQTKGNHSIHVQALRWDDAYRLLNRDSNLVMGYLVFMTMIIAWAIVTYLQQRSTVLVLFVFHQLAALLAAVTFLGVWRMYAPGGAVQLGNDLTSYAIPISTLASILFHARLLSDLGVRALFYKTLFAASAFPASGVVLIASGFIQTGLMITHVTIAIFMVFTIFAASSLKADASTDSRGRPIFIVSAYAIMAALMAPQSLRVLGLFPSGAWSFGAYFFYGVASAILMMSLLALRSREVERARNKNELALGEARRESELQRARADEQGDLIAMLTHELKTPLSVVSLALGNSGQQPAIQARAVQAIENMREVIDRCALTARVDEDVAHRSIELKVGPVQIREVVGAILNSHLQTDRLRFDVSGELPLCMTDRTMLLTIFGNLVDNALKYSPNESVVQLRAEAAGRDGRSGIRIVVTNIVGEQGAPDPQRVFEKYYRSARARHRSGSGLGLYLSRRLTQRLGGELNLLPVQASTVGFELWLPVVADS